MSFRIENFVSSAIVSEEVLKHQIQQIFGSRATHRAGRLGDERGWFIENGARVSKDRLLRLQSAQQMVDNAIKERARETERTKARTERARGNTSLPIRTDSKSYGKEASKRQLPSTLNKTAPAVLPRSTGEQTALSRHEIAAADSPSEEESGEAEYDSEHNVIGHKNRPRTKDRHKVPNIVSMSTDTRQGSSTSRSEMAALETSPRYSHPARSSSLLLNTTPDETAQKPGRHHDQRDSTRIKPREMDTHISVLTRSLTNNRHGSIASSLVPSQQPRRPSALDRHGNVNPSIAAKEPGPMYSEGDFPSLFEWLQYKREKAAHEASRQRSFQEVSSGDEMPETSSRTGQGRPTLFKLGERLPKAPEESDYTDDDGEVGDKVPSRRRVKITNSGTTGRRDDLSSSQPRTVRGSSYHDDDRSRREQPKTYKDDARRQTRHKDPYEDPIIEPNTGKQRGPLYIPGTNRPQ